VSRKKFNQKILDKFFSERGEKSEVYLFYIFNFKSLEKFFKQEFVKNILAEHYWVIHFSNHPKRFIKNRKFIKNKKFLPEKRTGCKI